MGNIKNFKKVLVANRGEIAIRIIRACRELGIRTIAIYTKEDETALFRTKADESYLIGHGKSAIDAYLDIDGIVELAVNKGADAIHPGYGFLSENDEFAKACAAKGIVFIGPRVDILERLGDKIQSKIVAREAGVPTIPGVEKPIHSEAEAMEFAAFCGYPVMVKAAAGGGGRGMRIVYDEEHLIDAFASAQSEARKAFGIDDMFIEKYVASPKHIEVQILGDHYGNVVHLYERDCSIQRRHQKVVEFTPAFALPVEVRDRICADAVKIAKSVNYVNAGTVEFLVDADFNHFFIEVNPRVQVEHTITELVTDIDIVQSQIRIAEGHALDSYTIGIPNQEAISLRGYAIQCRVTTEDPANNFAPDTGRIDVYRSGSGFGVRLDGGNGYTGAVISPYYDSLLVKVTTQSRTFEDAIAKSIRSLREMRISGVKTNIGFLLNLLNSPDFSMGICDTNYIANHPELVQVRPRNDVELKVLTHIGEIVVNDKKRITKGFDVPVIPQFEKPDNLFGTRQILEERGPEGLIQWIKDQEKLLLTDTTMRDAHQSLMATRMRTRDMVQVAEAISTGASQLFSLEMWGGATFDVSYRFLGESPWVRLDRLRKKIPNILFQMLLRGNNTVGYTNYPDNVVRKFIEEAAKSGIDIFRIFDSLNWIEGMRQPIELVREQGKVAEGTICYTGDILNGYRDKYSIIYYIKKAKELERAGAHLIGIKDMAGLLKPYAAKKLIRSLKNEVSLPIHLHTHDTTGNGVATVIMAAEAGVDIADTAFNAMSGLTSQPALNSVVAALQNTERNTGIDLEKTDDISNYWASVRQVYANFESELKSGSTEIYKYEIPGGQYSNLKPQVESFGLGHRFKDVKEMYRTVNMMMGDIVKVTPSSKMVGDMAIFMIQNDLTPENILEKGKFYDYPDSVISYMKGMMGQPDGGFPKELQAMILKGETPITVRPGELLDPVDFDAIAKHLKKTFKIDASARQLVSAALYPKVYDDYRKNKKDKGNLSGMGSDIYFHGLNEGETCQVEIEEGKTLIVSLVAIGKLQEDGYRALDFEVNGNRRQIRVKDLEASKNNISESFVQMVDPEDPTSIGASIPGTVLRINVEKGSVVKAGDHLMVIEAMKMETNIVTSVDGVVDELLVKEGETVLSDQLVVKLAKE